ncbi:hypothetical protein ES704_01980 [subsurface metagenome]|jgi:hypothetical protein
MPAYDYDIMASFPSIARDLIDIRHCNWVRANHYIEEAIYGYCKCEVTIYDDTQVSPIIYETEDGSLLTPTGTWETYLAKGELDFIDKWGIGEYKIIDGWWAIPKRVTRPLRVVMDRLLAYKESDNELVRLLAKRMSVGIYGKFGEEHKEEFGRHFNPVWFSEISTQVRLRVAQFIYERKLQESLIHVSVDGVLLSEPVGGT